MKQRGLTQEDLVVFPICLHQHWLYTAVDLRERRVWCYDGLQSRNATYDRFVCVSGTSRLC